jgi:hypothetical protein
MIETGNRQFTHHAKVMYEATPSSTRLDQNSTRTREQTSELARLSQFAAAETRTEDKTLEQRQRVIVWWLIALLWILFFMAGVILWEKASLGSWPAP